MKYKFLHISDLHYRPNWHEENGLVCKKFIEDIKGNISIDANTYLIFSGDLVFEGENTSLYAEFEAHFAKALNEAGFPPERRICAPGNHDVSRGSLKPLRLMQKATLAAIMDEQSFNDNLPQLSKLFFDGHFLNYKTYETTFAKYPCCVAGLGGAGWELPNGIGIYCLNTALCSFAGIDDETGKPISDQTRLMVDTRTLHAWLADTKCSTRVLVMHHPLDWLAGWAKSELEQIISSNFQLIFSGHVHANSAVFSSRGRGASVHCVAPPLFTKKTDQLGYSIVNMDTDNQEVEIVYRQWSQAQTFVAGTSLAGNDSGRIVFSKSINPLTLEVVAPTFTAVDTLNILQFEFDEAITCYSSKKKVWVDRDLANLPETASDDKGLIITTAADLIKSPRSCIIRAPMQYGLTSLGRYIALEYHRQSPNGKALVMMNTADVEHHVQGVVQCVELRCRELKLEPRRLAGIILDAWYGDKGTRRMLRNLKGSYPDLPIIIMQSLDDCTQIANAIEIEEEKAFESIFLWALTRERIRELVVKYVHGLDNLDDDLVTKKVITDIDALNIPRTPLNCLMILKLAEETFDDSPVNRTEMIGKVLFLLFHQFNKIPRYATRPDLKDCEFALGYFCEWLVCSGKTAFTKNEFYFKVNEYCTSQILDLEIEVLFTFLVSENLFVRKGIEFEFRFNYWLYYFAAHRMHHNQNFANFILSERRYSAFPEIIEFYAGIDRMRADAVTRLTDDLRQMNLDFSKRTGITDGFNPFRNAKWSPTPDAIEQLKQEVARSMSESSLPAVVKDRIADQNYNRAKPYHQALAKFINESSLKQMVQAMKGAARALRNSDHVSPEVKTKLLEEVISCWIRVCQILVLISPVLANQGRATFEGMGFYLDKAFDELESDDKRWKVILNVIVSNVVDWYQEDIFSKKMGALLSRYVHKNEGKLGELLVLLIIIKQKPPNWAKEIEWFIGKEQKNSFYLNKVFYSLHHEFKIGFSTERTRHDQRRLAAMAVAKHETGAKHPNTKLVEKAAKAIFEK